MASQSSRASTASAQTVIKYPSIATLYLTEFQLLIGPERIKFTTHKELLCKRSPYIARLCADSAPARIEHETLMSLKKEFDQVGDGPAANNVRPMVSAIDRALTSIPSRHLDDFNLIVKEAIWKYSGGIKKCGHPPEEDEDFRDWAIGILNEGSSLQVQNVLRTTLGPIRQYISALAKDTDPGVSVSFNRLYLPDTTPAAAACLLNYLYEEAMPGFGTFDKIAILTLYHVHALSAQLELFPLTNHCTDMLIGARTEMIQQPVAEALIQHYKTLKDRKFWRKVGILLLDIVVATQLDSLSDKESNDRVELMNILDGSMATYVSRTLLQRNIHRARLEAEYYAATRATNCNPGSPPVLLMPFQDAGQSCKKYHWHNPGSHCVSEVLRRTSRPRSDTIADIKQQPTPPEGSIGMHEASHSVNRDAAHGHPDISEISEGLAQVAGAKRKLTDSYEHVNESRNNVDLLDSDLPTIELDTNKKLKVQVDSESHKERAPEHVPLSGAHVSGENTVENERAEMEITCTDMVAKGAAKAENDDDDELTDIDDEAGEEDSSNDETYTPRNE